MIFFKDLDFLILAIKQKEKSASVFILLRQEKELIDSIIAQVTEEGYGLPAERSQLTPFLNFMSDFTIESDQLIDKERRSKKMTTCEDYLRFVAQNLWGDRLTKSPDLADVVLKRIAAEKDQMIRLISAKIPDPPKQEDSHEHYFTEAFIKLDQMIRSNAYRGGNIKKFISETGYNAWRDEIKKEKRRRKQLKERPFPQPEVYEEVDLPNLQLDTIEAYMHLQWAFLQLKYNCQRVMLAFFMRDDKNRTTMAKEAGYKTAESYNSALPGCQKKILKFLRLNYPEL